MRSRSASGSRANTPEPEALSQAVLALEQSLLSLDSVEEVRFLVDGELADTYGPIDLP